MEILIELRIQIYLVKMLYIRLNKFYWFDFKQYLLGNRIS